MPENLQGDGPAALDAKEVVAYLNEVWPQRTEYFSGSIQSLTPTSVRFVQTVDDDQDRRPGGTVAGPFLMHQADASAYVLVLGRLGREALAVTSHLGIDFLRRPTGPVIVADATLEKMGRSLAVCSVRLASAEPDQEPDMTKPEAIATVTYSLSLISSRRRDG